ncbi:DUF2798 domain-containing protein [Hylemonella gracilis]|uniref:DUF2798 domain-containing protein n=1 Tax=Hylemonella gracilis TaxID=80880 RepID=UPI000557B1E1|nr:DUF2798 domain-containing protein [Hylemonella gracilis]
MIKKKRILLTQVLMTGMMAAAMSGIMSLIALGPGALWLSLWARQFVCAWPIAFVMTTLIWPIANRLSGLLLRETAVH